MRTHRSQSVPGDTSNKKGTALSLSEEEETRVREVEWGHHYLKETDSFSVGNPHEGILDEFCQASQESGVIMLREEVDIFRTTLGTITVKGSTGQERVPRGQL
jgi:hypothetical protein